MPCANVGAVRGCQSGLLPFYHVLFRARVQSSQTGPKLDSFWTEKIFPVHPMFPARAWVRPFFSCKFPKNSGDFPGASGAVSVSVWDEKIIGRKIALNRTLKRFHVFPSERILRYLAILIFQALVSKSLKGDYREYYIFLFFLVFLLFLVLLSLCVDRLLIAC